MQEHYERGLLDFQPQHLDMLQGLYNRVAHITPALSTLPLPALNSQHNYRNAEKQYLASMPHIHYLDDFLSPQALHRLQRFCLESTIWFDVKEDGYIGAISLP